ncbi:TPA: helix-turn-helix transcriptional regulator [Pseudomonas aeruginosa]|nr:helix-turn-helix transcriptional regulator [Pseudomonas aeruginosa]
MLGTLIWPGTGPLEASSLSSLQCQLEVVALGHHDARTDWKFTAYCEDSHAVPPESAPSPRGQRLDVTKTFGKVLRRRRKELGLTQEKLALEAGIQRNYVSLIERGINQPTITMIFKLATVLKCSPSALVSDTENLLDQPSTQME